jgi:hypothetical protein
MRFPPLFGILRMNWGRRGGFWGVRIHRPKSHAPAPEFTNRKDTLKRIIYAKQFLSAAQQIEDKNHLPKQFWDVCRRRNTRKLGLFVHKDGVLIL